MFVTDIEQEKLIQLLSSLKEDNAVNSGILQDSFKSLCHMLDERENELPKATAAVSVLFCHAITEHLTTLSEVASLTDNGTHYPLFWLILQQIHQKKGRSELVDLYNESKVNLMAQLPESDKTKERLSEILEQRDLVFLYPLLRVQAELARQLQVLGVIIFSYQKSAVIDSLRY